MSRASSIAVSERQAAILEKWRRNRADTPARLVERCAIILLSAKGLSNQEQGRRLGVDRQRIRRWRTRWLENEERLAAAENEGASDKDLAELLRKVLSDDPRSGTPSKFTAEQLTQIIAVACELPEEESGRPVTHWTPRELADEVIKRGIVDTISPRHVDRVLKGGISARTKRNTG
jgi:putative transposase